LRQHAFEIPPRARHVVVAVKVDVAAHADVFDAREFLDVIEMIEEMLDGRM